jgi:hypothetical protein
MQMYCQVCSKQPSSVETLKQTAFLQQYADVTATATRTGYNPMLEDFTNTAVLLS